MILSLIQQYVPIAPGAGGSVSDVMATPVAADSGGLGPASADADLVNAVEAMVGHATELLETVFDAERMRLLDAKNILLIHIVNNPFISPANNAKRKSKSMIAKLA